jgi:hypothetical protein
MFKIWSLENVVRQNVEAALGGGGGAAGGGGATGGAGAGNDNPSGGGGANPGNQGGTAGGGNGGGAGGGPNNQPTTITIDFAKLPAEHQALFKTKGWEPGKEGVGEVIASSYFHANKAISGAQDVIVIPGENAPVEQVNAFRAKLGVPANVEGYTPAFKQLEGVEGINPDFVNWAKSTFHRDGVPVKAAESIVKSWQEFAAAAAQKEAEASVRANEAGVQKVKAAFGAEWDKVSAAGLNVVKSIGLSAEANDFFTKNKGVAAVAELMAKIGQRIGTEGRFVTNEGGGAPTDPSQMTPAQADEAIKALQANAEFMKAYNTKGHPEHDAAVQKMLKLNEAKARRA